MEGRFTNITIEGIKAVVPSRIIENMMFAEVLGERRCKKQIKLTGVRERHISGKKQTSADLACAAGSQLLKELDWAPETIDVLIFATQNPIFTLPSTAFFLQKRLGIKKDCVVFDVNLGCSAATVGIQIVSSLLQQGPSCSRGLLLTSDPVPELTDQNEADQMLFGAAGAAIALQRTGESVPLLAFSNKSDGNRYKAISRLVGGGFSMDGAAVFEFAVNDVVNDFCDFRRSLGLTPTDVDYYVFHQAQALMLSTMRDSCDIPPERELRSLERYGNTNGSSILVTLCAQDQGLWKKKQANFLLCGFGVGLSWCSIYMTMDTSRIFPLSISDDIYEEIEI